MYISLASHYLQKETSNSRLCTQTHTNNLPSSAPAHARFYSIMITGAYLTQHRLDLEMRKTDAVYVPLRPEMVRPDVEVCREIGRR